MPFALAQGLTISRAWTWDLKLGNTYSYDDAVWKRQFDLAVEAGLSVLALLHRLLFKFRADVGLATGTGSCSTLDRKTGSGLKLVRLHASILN